MAALMGYFDFALHNLFKFAFLGSLLTLVVIWPSISLLALIIMHLTLVVLSLIGNMFKSTMVGYVRESQTDRNGIDKRWQWIDTTFKVLVFQFENRKLVAINILYVIILLGNLNYFFQYQGDIVPPATIRGMDGKGPLGTRDHTLFQVCLFFASHLLFISASSTLLGTKYAPIQVYLLVVYLDFCLS